MYPRDTIEHQTQCRSLPCTHDIPSNTKHNVHLYHALTPMSCDVPVYMQCKMPLHVISCHMYNECYMDNTIYTTYRCHGQSHHLHMTSINHFINVNLSCKHISTSTSHHQSSNDLHYTLGLIVTPCLQIDYNQAMQWPCSYTNTSQAKPLERYGHFKPCIILMHHLDNHIN